MHRKNLAKTLLTFLLLSLLFAAGIFLSKQRSVKACHRPPTCEICEFPCSECGCCPTQTPTPTPTPTPTEEPSPTPTEVPEPTPTEVVPTPTPERGHELGGPPVCGSETPNAPYLKSATALGGNKIKLVWDPVEKASHYSISYGSESGDYPWGVFNTGNTTEYTVEGLSGGCFAVKAVNDCAPSDLSNEVCTGAISQVLGLSTTSSENQLESVAFWIGILISLLGVKTLATQLSLLSNEK